MFQSGDLVVYGNMGVCRVDDVICGNDLQWLEAERQYYRLVPLYQEGASYVPVDSDKVIIRSVISEGVANQLIDQMPQLEKNVEQAENIQAIRARYQNASRTGDCMELLALVMSIYVRKKDCQSQKRKISQMDERFMRQAEDLLFGEFAVALQIDRDDVSNYISERLRTVRC